MRICVVGSGGREHALADVLARDAEVVVAPGNPGMSGSVDTAPEEVSADLFVIGPEAPLVGGLADRLRSDGRLVFGPCSAGARLEGSKAWMKQILDQAGVPTAAHGAFTDEQSALRFLDTMNDLFVIKTDGLAAGKGVLVTSDRDEARTAVRSYLSGDAFGEAGRTVVIEEGLTGPELSVLAVCDGQRAVPLAPAQDFKRIGEDDTGPNTGGMGAYSPVALATTEMVDTLMNDAIEPTLAALRSHGIDYRGVLYAGLMFTPDGSKMLEYNVRFGDPEAQVVLPRLDTDLADLLAAAAAGSLGADPSFSSDAAVCVVAATEGYPGSPRTGDVIEGIAEARALDGVSLYFASVGRDEAGRLVTAGGRVLDVCGRAPDLATARRRAYDGMAAISWLGSYHRTDIARDAVTLEAAP